MQRPLSLLAALLLTAGCSAELPHDSPYDPEAPLSKQAHGKVAGMVALEGETDYGQVTVELQNGERTYTGSSRSDGGVELTGVVPGEYTLRYTARYFEESIVTVEVALGEALDLGVHTLALKKAAVEGKASAIRAAGTVGGLVVTLYKAASIRGADAGAAPAWLPVYFSAAEPPVLSFTAVSGGDGTFRIEGVPAGVYDVYVGSVVVGKVTVTGEQAVVTLDPVTLDEAGPAVPNLVVGDNDGDGFALDATTVELNWTKPSEADLSHFELQRYVVGVDAGFADYATLDKAVTTLDDDVAATSGRKHLYRIRSIDEIGNASDWSLVAEADPFEATDEAYWLQGGDGVHYYFPVRGGTNSLSAVYFYNDAAKSRFSEALANNVTEWLRPAASTGRWEEAIMLRASNQNNTLAYESDFSLGINRRSIVAHDNTGAYLGYGCGIAVDGAGNAHVAYSDGAYGGMWLGVQDGDGWKNTRIDDDGNTYYYVEAFLYKGAHKVIYNDSSKLKYATDASGSWVVTTLTNIDFRGMSAAIDSAGRIHVVGLRNNSGTNTTVQYLRIDNNAIAVTEDVVTVNWQNQSAGVAVASDFRVHIAFYSGATGDLVYGTRAPAGGWGFTTVDSTGDVGQYPSLALDMSGNLHMAYLAGSDLRYLYKAAGSGWDTPVSVNLGFAASKYTAVRATPEGERFVFYTDQSQSRLYVARRNNSTGWTSTQVETPINQYYGHSLRAVVDARHRVHAVYMHNDERDVRHLVMSSGARPEEVVGTGYAYDAEIASVNSGEIHLAFGHWSLPNLMHATNRGGTWTTTTLATGTQRGKLMAAHDGTVHAAFANPDLRYATESNGAWSSEVVAAAGSLWDYSLAYPTGATTPGIAYGTSGNPSRLFFTEKPAAKWSAPVTIAAVANPAYFGTVRLAYGKDGPVVAASLNGYYKEMQLYKRTGAVWAPYNVALPATTATVQDLKGDADGALHILFHEEVDLDLWYGTNRGGAWAFRRVDTEGDTGYQARMIIDDRGFVHIAFMSSGADFSYATDVGGWHTAKVIDAPWGVTRIGFARDGDGNLHGLSVNGSSVTALPFLGGRLQATSSGRVSGW